MLPFISLWNPDSPRAVLFSEELREQIGQCPTVMTWEDFLAGNSLPGTLERCVVRIESPGKHWGVEKALLRAGASRAQNSGFDALSCEAIGLLPDEPGWIHASRQHYLGLCHTLRRVRDHYDSPAVRWMQHPDDIVVMSDKFACQTQLTQAGVSVPLMLGIPASFDDLMSRMNEAKVARVFLKLCHGSSASGTVALEHSRGRIQAFSTAKMFEDTSNRTRLKNWRAATRYEDLRDVRRLVDAVCTHRACAEQWIPKMGWQGRRFDVRVVVIAGIARHMVARLSEEPFTNLQFGAKRAGISELREHLGSAAFSALVEAAESALACFPRSLYGGVDIALRSHDKRPYVLEVNAWGDLLPGVLCEGRSTYAWEIAQVSATGS